MDAEIKKEFDRLNAKLTALLQEKKKKTWIKASSVMQLTGWDKEVLRRMRQDGLVEWKNEDGFFYCYESIPEFFLKKQIA